MGMYRAEGSIGKGPGTGGSTAQYERETSTAGVLREEFSLELLFRKQGLTDESGEGCFVILKSPSGFYMKDGLKRGPEWQRAGWAGKQKAMICLCLTNP